MFGSPLFEIQSDRVGVQGSFACWLRCGARIECPRIFSGFYLSALSRHPSNRPQTLPLPFSRGHTTHVAILSPHWTAAAASLINSMASVQAQVAGPAQQAQQQQQLWQDARASLQTGVAILVAAAAAFGLFVWRMPPLQVRGHTQAAPCLHACKQAPQPHTRCAAAAASAQAHELTALMANFPPRSLASIISVRDTMLAYAQSYPVSSRAQLATTQLRPPRVGSAAHACLSASWG